MTQQNTRVGRDINGEEVEFLCEPRQSLLEVLRETLGLTGAKEGCNNGNCGACNVILDGVLVNSCLVLAVEVEGKPITTIEGIAPPDGLHPLAAEVPGARRAAVRHLHAGLHRGGQGAAGPATRIPASTKCAAGWRATCAAAPATTRSCAPCWTRPRCMRAGGSPCAEARWQHERNDEQKHGRSQARTYQVIGTRPIRHDGADKVTGRALYGADVRLPGMLYGAVLRSPHAHARILSIDTSQAEALPGRQGRGHRGRPARAGEQNRRAWAKARSTCATRAATSWRGTRCSTTGMPWRRWRPPASTSPKRRWR